MLSLPVLCLAAQRCWALFLCLIAKGCRYVYCTTCICRGWLLYGSSTSCTIQAAKKSGRHCYTCHTGRFDRAKFEGDKFEKESIIIIIHRKITDKFAGERLGREKFHGWNCQAYQNPPTPAFAKAGAAPGTTAGVELVFLGFKRLSDSWQLRSACRLPLLLERCHTHLSSRVAACRLPP